MNPLSSAYQQRTFCELIDRFSSVREPFWSITCEVRHFLPTEINSYGWHFLHQFFSSLSRFFFTILTNFEQARRFIFFEAPVFGLLVTLPFSFHFFIMDCSELTGTLNWFESFLYSFPASCSWTMLFLTSIQCLLPLSLWRCWQIFTWWSPAPEWPIPTPISTCSLAGLLVNVI